MTMNLPSIQRRYAISTGVFITATVVLVVVVLSPSSIVVIGSERSATLELASPQFWETLSIAAVSCVFGSSGMYLFLNTPDDSNADHASTDTDQPNPRERDSLEKDNIIETRRQEWKETAQKLSDREEAIYRAVLDADGVLPQSEIVERTDCSKATVSRALDNLEAKNLVERKRRGVGNIVLLQ
ncbi:helix-turn-helix transcriptional regulator [Halosimplex pelagicum]|uniref:MarR family transcriptional regulator n=1 Tax=Halosimplex pelagicum TaxID=869886 RepID=A0A7D5P7T2_9EURY|nr:MarR family transcriptional regulator [Halosimplex pelagicum]QLH81361.1 MarR family transcriptional regulator [Halosimplex pelagicum]